MIWFVQVLFSSKSPLLIFPLILQINKYNMIFFKYTYKDLCSAMNKKWGYEVVGSLPVKKKMYLKILNCFIVFVIFASQNGY